MPKRNLLLIDDEAEFCKLVKINLELMSSFRVHTATNGQDGCELAKKIKPDLILLDVLMPGMDGLKVLKRLREDKDTGEIPVIMLTASADETSKVKASRLSVELFISKPIDATDLIARIEKVFKKKD